MTTTTERRCATPKCGAILSRYNAGPVCQPCERTAARRHMDRTRDLRDPAARFAVILAVLATGRSTVYKLSMAVGVSETTIRRDVLELIALGKVARGTKHGGSRNYVLGPRA